jgi:hypothetical protein
VIPITILETFHSIMTRGMDNFVRLDPGKFRFRGLHPNILERIKWRKRMNLIINNRAGAMHP